PDSTDPGYLAHPQNEVQPYSRLGSEGQDYDGRGIVQACAADLAGRPSKFLRLELARLVAAGLQQVQDAVAADQVATADDHEDRALALELGFDGVRHAPVALDEQAPVQLGVVLAR